MSTQEDQFLRALIPTVPTEFSQRLRTLCGSNPANEAFLENFTRLISGAPCGSDASPTLQAEWSAKQAATRQVLADLMKPHQTEANAEAAKGKRPREDAEDEGSKRQRTSPPEASSTNDEPVQYILHAISTTSPVRKKLDIELRTSSITFTNSSTKTLEATIPLSVLRRAFVIPTRGKTKPHWTVVLMSSDVTLAKPVKGAPDESPQIIFGVDAASTTPWSTSSRESDGGELKMNTQAKGADTLLSIKDFLSRLPAHITQHEPAASEFKSIVSQFGGSSTGAEVPGLQAYRAAKPGNLWFTKDGLLWGESKPCEFWDVEDLLSPMEGARVGLGSGRVFDLTLVRKTPGYVPSLDDEGQEEEDIGIETTLGMIDSRERDALSDWVRRHQPMFGRKRGVVLSAKEKAEEEAKAKAAKVAAKQLQSAGPVTIRSLALDSDSEDEDFVGSSESDSSSGGEDSGDESGSGGDDENDDGEGEEEEDEAQDSDAEGEGEQEELDPARHPLMRPGAVPKMSKAMMDMVVDMVEDDMMGEGGDEEVDELDD